MNCRDCLHYEVCESISKRESLATLYCAEECPCFKDKSEWVRLPCKVGQTVYMFNDGPCDAKCNGCEFYSYRYNGNVTWCNKVNNISEPPECREITGVIATKDDIIYWLGNDCFGETVFLTKEESEKVLEEMKKK